MKLQAPNLCTLHVDYLIFESGGPQALPRQHIVEEQTISFYPRKNSMNLDFILLMGRIML